MGAEKQLESANKVWYTASEPMPHFFRYPSPGEGGCFLATGRAHLPAHAGRDYHTNTHPYGNYSFYRIFVLEQKLI